MKQNATLGRDYIPEFHGQPVAECGSVKLPWEWLVETSVGTSPVRRAMRTLLVQAKVLHEHAKAAGVLPGQAMAGAHIPNHRHGFVGVDELRRRPKKKLKGP